jgi:MSHA biogenesis protein MshN
MSLINDMLRNIEAKRPDDPARQNLQREIRSLPAAPSGQGLWLKLLLLIGVPLVGAAVLHANGQLLPLFSIEAAPVAVSIPVPPPVPVPPATTEATAGPRGDAQKEPISDNDLRLAPSLAVLPTPAAPVLPVPDPIVPAPVANVAKGEPAALVAEASKPAPVVSVGPVKIEKSPVLATPRDRADAEYRKAENALSAGRSAEAIEGLRAALKHDPVYVQVRQALLRQLLEMRKSEEAMAVLQEGIDLQPAQTGWAMSLARLQLEHNDLTAADRTLARSQAYAEASADYAGFQGHVKSRLGAHRQAVGHYQRAARLAPGEGRWWLGLGLALEADGRVPEAKDAFRRSMATATLSAELAAVAEQHLH